MNEHILQHVAQSRYMDPHLKKWAIKILPGEFFVVDNEDMIVTTLGSCISVCIRDKVLGIGGMNHFMLPLSTDGDWCGSKISTASRYGNFAMEYLINEILKQGGKKKNMEAKIFGGGDFMMGNTLSVGSNNYKFAEQYLKTEGIPIKHEDVGGSLSRKIYFSPLNGKVLMKKIAITQNDTIRQREKRYQYDIEHTNISGDVELF